MLVKETFNSLLSKHSTNTELNETLWQEIESNYTHKKRHYHSLSHLENLLNQLTEIKSQIQDWDTLLFSVFYHDIIYHSKSQKNEENSAELAQKRLAQINYPAHKIQTCFDQIIATKTHKLSPNNDTNLFTDADLSILGTDWKDYEKYTNQIRLEYSIYPDFVYKPGRKKVLRHFLEMARIFKTDYFYSKFEKQARLNLNQELTLL